MKLAKNSSYKMNLNMVHNPYYTLSRIYREYREIRYGNDFSAKIEINSPLLNHTDAKILWYILYKMQVLRKSNIDVLDLAFNSIYQILKEMGIGISEDNYKRVGEAFQKFMHMEYTFSSFYKEKKRKIVILNGLIRKITIDKKTGEITLTFNPEFLDMNEGIYSRIFNLPLMLSFNPTAARLYEIIDSSTFGDENTCRVKVDTLAEKMYIDNKKYSQTLNLIRDSISDINKKLKEFEVNKHFRFMIDDKKVIYFMKEMV
jgi:hypothetical protein